MKLLKTRILPAFLALMLMLALLVQPISVSALTVANVGALWDGFTSGSGTFTVTPNSRVYVVSETAPTGNLLQTVQLIQRELRAHFGEDYFKELVWGDAEWAAPGDIVLNLDSASGTGADGYKLDVNATTATVTAADTDGLIYGANNLIKCFRAVGGNSISGFSGNDTPDTKERTVHLDLARKYYTVEWVCNFIRQMSWMGYNALELHLSEDGGFRADFWDSAYYTDNYTPENDFSWLCGSHVQSWVKDPYRTDPNAGDYLTTSELVQICEVAKEYHIEIIPSFDSPAHMDYITWKFEQNYKNDNDYSFTYGNKTYKASTTSGCINYTGTTGASSPTWPYYTTINISKNSTDTMATMAKAFVFALYEDMADFFKEYAGSTKFNIGADEVNLSSGYGIKWNYESFPVYVNTLNKILNNKGYTVRMYNDFIGSTTYNQSSSYKAKYSFDSNIEIVYWNSDFDPTTGKWPDPVWHVKFFWENNTGSSDNWGDGGRTMYNAIQTNTYYVLREGTSGTHRDARDPNNRNWTFYGTNEEAIYKNWYPADISEKGVYTEDAADVPADQLGGAYFLIWNDYAALNTESEVWNGALDCYDKDRYYYLFDIMASNIIKMWNSDINSTVTYTEFAEVREAVNEWFPGFTSCSKAASLPDATEPKSATAADHTALEAALAAVMTEQGNYTDESWSNYQAAITEAEKVNSDPAATAEEILKAITDLKNAENALEEKLTVDKSALRSAVDSAIPEQGNYTIDSWNTYQNALAAAKEVLNNDEATQDEVNRVYNDLASAKAALVDTTALKNSITRAENISEASIESGWEELQSALNTAKTVNNKSNAAQTEVDNATNALNTAISNLKYVEVAGTHVYNIQKLSETATAGKYAGLIIYTDPAVTELTFENASGNDVVPEMCIHNTQTLADGERGVWLVNIYIAAAGDYTYTVYANSTKSGTITITAK